MRYLFFTALGTLILSVTAFAQDKPVEVSEAVVFEEKLIQALRKGDRVALEDMIADGFIFIHSTGPIETKKQYIESAAASSLAAQRMEMQRSDETWRVYNGNTAIHYAKTVMTNPVTGAQNRLRNISVFVKGNGRWQIASGQSTKLPVRPKAGAVDKKLQDSYVGEYAIGPGRAFKVTNETGTLFGVTTGRSKFELVPRSENTFVLFNEDNDPGFFEVTFVKETAGMIAVMRQNGQEIWRATR